MKALSALCLECSPPIESVLNLLNRWTHTGNYNTKLFTTKYNCSVENQSYTVLPIYEAKYNYGTMVVWDVQSLDLIIDFPNVDKIIFLQGDQLPWIENKNLLYNMWKRIFEDPRVVILSTNKNVADIYKLTWNKGNLVSSLTDEDIHEYL